MSLHNSRFTVRITNGQAPEPHPDPSNPGGPWGWIIAGAVVVIGTLVAVFSIWR